MIKEKAVNLPNHLIHMFNWVNMNILSIMQICKFEGMVKLTTTSGDTRNTLNKVLGQNSTK